MRIIAPCTVHNGRSDALDSIPLGRGDALLPGPRIRLSRGDKTILDVPLPKRVENEPETEPISPQKTSSVSRLWATYHTSSYERSIEHTKIVGMEEKKDSCMKIAKVGNCANLHDSSQVVLRHHCKSKKCRACWSSWAVRECDNAGERLEAYGTLDVRAGALRHFVFSPPQVSEHLSELEYKKLRTSLYKKLKIAGVVASAVIFHPYRVVASADALFKEDKKKGDPAARKGLWSYLRAKHMIKPPWVYLSPHFHVVGYGFLMKSNEFYDQTGWVYKKIREIKGNADLRGLLFYALSHSGVMGRTETLTYSGGMSYRKMGVRLLGRTREPLICPDCDEPVNETVGWNQKEEFDEEIGMKTWKWKWNEAGAGPPRWSMPSFPLSYVVEKREYRMKDRPEKRVCLSRGGNPLSSVSRAPPIAEKRHLHHAYDWSHGVWLDEDGSEVQDE